MSERLAEIEARVEARYVVQMPDGHPSILAGQAVNDAEWLLEREKKLREAGDKLFAAMPKKSSIWDTFREENIATMREALEAWAALTDTEAG